MSDTKRVALVIGNSNYGDSNDVSGVEDAKAIAECLGPLGFEVLPPVLDQNLQALNQALEEFGDRIHDADVALLFYSGHGFRSGGRSYLLPPGGPASPEGALLLDTFLRTLGLSPDTAFRIAFLDACRNDKRFPVDQRGLAEPSKAPTGVLQAFAASPGQLAASGSADGLSPYTMALLQYLPEPGLELNELFAKVHAFVPSPQQPIEAGAIPLDFFFRKPVFVHAEIPGGHNDLLVVLNGKIVMNTNQSSQMDLRLNAGDNDLVLLVSNGRTHRNGFAWERTEGWSYRLDLVFPDGGKKTFEDHEEIPFKDGPHHGKVFTVARARIHVDRGDAKTTLLDPDTDVWNREAPVWARNQGLLFEQSITDLNLAPEEILGGAVNPGSLAPLLRPFIVEFLRSGKIFGVAVADPSRTFVTVRGNLALKSLVETCMDKRQERIDDLKASIAAAFNRDPTPFSIFDQGLMKSMRDTARDQGSMIQPNDIRIWTAIEDRSRETAPAAVGAAAVTASLTPELVYQS